MRRIKKAIPFILSLFFISTVLYFIPFDELKYSLKKITLTTLIISFLFYMLSIIIRTLKWYVLVKEIPLKKLFLITSFNIFANNVFPARTGELSWIYYSVREKISLKDSVSVLLINRIYDLLGLISVFAVATILHIHPEFLLLFILFLLFIFKYFHYIFSFIPPVWKLKEIKEKLREFLNDTISLELGTLSLLAYLFKFLSLYILIETFYELEFLKAVIGLSGSELSSVLPVHTFMGYGTFEVGFIIPLKILGEEDIRELLMVSFLIHNFLLLFSAIPGILSFILLHRKSQ